MAKGSLKTILKSWVEAERFMPSILGVFTNPFFITRKSLCIAIAERANLIQGKTLDFGCGSKPYEKIFINATKYIGCDIEVSGHNHQSSKVDVFYDGKILPFEKQEFDSIVSFETFEHVFNINGILSELNRVLKPNGTMLVTVPFVWAEHEVPYDFARYSTYGMRYILETNGFEVVEIERLGGNADVVAQLFMASIVESIKSEKVRLLVTALVHPIIFLFSVMGRTFLPGGGKLFLNSICIARKKEIGSDL